MTEMNLSNEEIGALAEVERKMDRGEQPYVVNHGNRLAVMEEVMHELGLETGQTASDVLMASIIRAQIGVLEAKIEMEKING